MPSTAHGRLTRHFPSVPQTGTRVAVSALRERMDELYRLASVRGASDPEQAQNLRARAAKLQDAIDIMENG